MPMIYESWKNSQKCRFSNYECSLLPNDLPLSSAWVGGVRSKKAVSLKKETRPSEN